MSLKIHIGMIIGCLVASCAKDIYKPAYDIKLHETKKGLQKHIDYKPLSAAFKDSRNYQFTTAYSIQNYDRDRLDKQQKEQEEQILKYHKNSLKEEKLLQVGKK